MDFGEDRRTSKNTLIGIGAVILLHIFLIYALISGLATSAIDIIKKPLEIKIIQEAPPAPPTPPQIIPPPPPKLTTPPPPYIPPPIIQVQAPPQQVFTVVTQKAPPPQQAVPVSTSASVVCPNVVSVASRLSDDFQQIADDDNITNARVVVVFTVGPDGSISNPTIASSDSNSVNALALRGIGMLKCKGQGKTVEVSAPFDFQSQ